MAVVSYCCCCCCCCCCTQSSDYVDRYRCCCCSRVMESEQSCLSVAESEGLTAQSWHRDFSEWPDRPLTVMATVLQSGGDCGSGGQQRAQRNRGTEACIGHRSRLVEFLVQLHQYCSVSCWLYWLVPLWHSTLFSVDSSSLSMRHSCSPMMWWRVIARQYVAIVVRGRSHRIVSSAYSD